MATMMTPGVYIKEVNAFPNSVVEVATAVPAFVGYTEKAADGVRSLTDKPHRISSMAEYELYFGGAAPLVGAFTLGDAAPDPLDDDGEMAVLAGPSEAVVTLGEGADKKEYFLSRKPESHRYQLHSAMRWFFQNGGGPCWIVSVGGYDATPSKDDLTDGIQKLLKEREPTMVVVPEAVYLNRGECAAVQQAAIDHCSGEMSRVAVLDVHRGFLDKDDCVPAFREVVGGRLDYAAAYYPWVDTSVVASTDPAVTFRVFDDTGISAISDIVTAEPTVGEEQKAIVDAKLAATDPDDVKAANDSLLVMSKKYKGLMKELLKEINRLPPAAAMAGIYSRVDADRGVWKAPANVNVAGAVAPAVNISAVEQEDLNVDANAGKSVNAIRSFVGRGTLVWGARTLAGNSLDWRYINVRRTMIMLEQSVKLATEAYVFEPNDAQTWVTIRSMIRNFLTGIWKRGGLAGASPDEAFSVHVGLGETMTPEDILEGILRVSVLVAPTRPAEFIEITFQQKMQES